MESLTMKEIKCTYCNTWVNGTSDECGNCNQTFYVKEKKEIEIRKKSELQPMNIPLIKIYEHDSILLKIVKYIIRFHQIIFLSIVSYLAWITAWLAG